MTAMQTLFTDSYAKFTHWVSRIEVKKEADEQKAKIRVPEKTVRCIWNDQLFKTDSLCTIDGRELEIIFRGYWNFGPGPDFKDAVIKINGKTLEGDVEVHTHSSDRERQGQSIDPEYGNVILNVFLWNSESNARSGDGISQLELKQYLTRGILDLNAELDFDSFPDQNS